MEIDFHRATQHTFAAVMKNCFSCINCFLRVTNGVERGGVVETPYQPTWTEQVWTSNLAWEESGFGIENGEIKISARKVTLGEAPIDFPPSQTRLAESFDVDSIFLQFMVKLCGKNAMKLGIFSRSLTLLFSFTHPFQFTNNHLLEWLLTFQPKAKQGKHFSYSKT